MGLLICPGMHNASLTDQFLDGIQIAHAQSDVDSECLFRRDRILIFPIQNYPAYSAFHIWQFLQTHYADRPRGSSSSVVLLSFSAGVVGAIGAAWAWQQSGGEVRAFIALDGWGVPLYGDFPIHRVSHDYFTHWSSALLGQGCDNFYADPAVDHLELWRSPQTATGWSLSPSPDSTKTSSARMTAATFISVLLARYQVFC